MNTPVNLRLSKSQNRILKSLARKNGISKGAMIRRKLFGLNSDIIDPTSEIDYTPEEQEEDRLQILADLEYLNKNILTNLPNVPYARRQSLLNQLETLRRLIELKQP